MNSERIAIVGIGLRYPDANSPDELWENVLAGRRAFRRLPDERMNRADYWSSDRDAPDRFYATKAAVLRDYVFDRVRHMVAGSTYRSTDLTHWLALDVAAGALADAGFPGGAGLPAPTTGVVIGNSLTGEFSRANLMRVRWPYVRRTVAAALAGRGWAEDETGMFLRELEIQYKAPFPAGDEDTLAGGLANTIAGRICNHFDLGGGGYTVDGACSSSLLSVATAAGGLADGDLDVAVAGGVDLSIDPFEMIGFARTGALATGEMKVYDRDSTGFWPGEGAGLLVLMREQDAIAQAKRVYAVITGWGVSSDGKGAITRPEPGGHRLALARAYRRAGYGVETVSYFEGHGTGTALGDATEIEALSAARREADPTACPAALSTIKGNLGHTKAAAGAAGLIKAVLALHHQVIPPATGHNDPHPSLLGEHAALSVPRQAQLWPADQPVRAGVSAMGFGGINTHVAVEQAAGIPRRDDLDQRTQALVTGRQDAELLLLDGDSPRQVRDQLTRLADIVPKLSYAELADLAGTLAGQLSGGPVRAALVVTSPEDAERAITRLLDSGTVFSPAEGIFFGRATTAPRIVYLFPGQGSGRGTVGAIRRRFAAAAQVFDTSGLPSGGDHVATEVAQPRIVTGSLAALRVLSDLGIEADTAVGHSLGELTALHWAGAVDQTQLLRLARMRGHVMASANKGGGAMAGLAATPSQTRHLLRGEDVVIAGYNGPRQTVVSGPAAAVDRVCRSAAAAGTTATRIAVSHAFHSPLVEPAAAAMTACLADFPWERPIRPMLSTVTGDVLDTAADLRALLRDQVLSPVRFHEAAAKATAGADLAIEVGPGRVLSGLLTEIAPELPVLPTDTDSPSLAAILRVVGAAWTLGAPVRTEALFEGRLIRPLPLDANMTFLTNPCESAPAIDPTQTIDHRPTTVAEQPSSSTGSTLDLLRKLAAERLELPLEAVDARTHPLDDLHLSSITVGQLVNEVTRTLGHPVLETTPNFATVRLGELADLIDQLAKTAVDRDTVSGAVAGVAPWVRAFSVVQVEAPRVPPPSTSTAVSHWTVHAEPGNPWAQPLRAALATAGIGDGVLLCVPATSDVDLLMDAGRAVADAPAGTRFVVVQQGFGASGFARTVHLEYPSIPTTLVDTTPDAIQQIVAETAATTGFSEVRYDSAGNRTVPRLRPLRLTPRGTPPLDARDVLLVTGGGKGITAECALALAKDSAASLAILGRADPDTDIELAANLSRMAAAGVRFRYQRADVTFPEQVTAAVDRIQAELGPVTAVLHGAGRNQPSALTTLTADEFRRTLAPKVDGLQAVLAAVDPEQIKLLITFGSIIGRAGLRGEAHYATANEWLTELTVRFHHDHPKARALALEWSVWSGAGMGERLGVVEGLMREGITPISADDGVQALRAVLADPDAGPAVVISGRASGLPTLTFEPRELPLTRFAERVVTHYPDIELVTEADLSEGNDPYLADHHLDGDLLFPAVVGMEAMTQVAAAVTANHGPPLLEDVEFTRPVVVRPGGSTTIRLAALTHDTDTVDVVLRSEETGFAADHFRARVRFDRPPLPASTANVDNLPAVALYPATELYGRTLFQGTRFQRLTRYRRLSARHVVAELSTGTNLPWFAEFLPQQHLLADPGTRDAVMHAIQCCVPDATLLPLAVERIWLADRSGPVVLDARERSQDGDTYIYDVDVRTPSGVVIERWEGLTLRAVRKQDGTGPWVAPLLGPYLERALERILGGSRAVVVEPSTNPNRRARTRLAVSRALGRPVHLHYRPDGKPEADGMSVSASHSADLTLAVVGNGKLACDIESVTDRDWADLLSPGQIPVRDLLREPLSLAGTRIWSAVECLRKAGATSQALTVDRVHPDGWVTLSAGDAHIATWTTTVDGQPHPVVVAVLVGKDH